MEYFAWVALWYLIGVAGSALGTYLDVKQGRMTVLTLSDLWILAVISLVGPVVFVAVALQHLSGRWAWEKILDLVIVDFRKGEKDED